MASDPRKCHLCPKLSQAHLEKRQVPVSLPTSLPPADVPAEAGGQEGSAVLGAAQTMDRSCCVSEQRKKEARRIQAPGEPSAQAGTAAAIGRKRGEAQTRRPNEKTKPQEKSQRWASGRAGEPQEQGEGTGERQCCRAPHGQGPERKKRQRTRGGKQRGSGSQLPLTPASLNFGVAVVTASKGQGGRERVGPELPGQEKPSWMLPGAFSRLGN